MKVLLTCNPGTEDVTAAEAEYVLDARVTDLRVNHGRIMVDSSIDNVELLSEKIYELRTIHYAGLLIFHEMNKNPSLEWIRESVATLGLEDFVPETAAYAVRTVREGDHLFSSMDVSRVVGEAIRNGLARKGFTPLVRLNSPSILFRVDIIEDNLYVSLSLTGERSRHIRGYRVYDHPASLKPTLAAVMLRLAGTRDGDTVLDPMCGSGTISIEAALLLEDSKILCNDISSKYVMSAMFNSMIARVRNRIIFHNHDIRDLAKMLEGRIDVIAVNPPYGIRLGSRRIVKMLYRDLADVSSRILSSNGRISVITPDGGLMRNLLEERGFHVLDYRRVRHGDLWVKIVTAQYQ